MEQLLKSLYFFLPFMASVEAHIPDEVTAFPLPDQASTLTESLTLGVLAPTSAPPQEAAQDAPGGNKRNHSGEDGSVATEVDSTTDDLRPPLKKQKLQQTGSESELAEDDPQQLLNQYLVGFDALETPADNFCWLHAIHLSADQDVATLIETLIDMINHHLPGNEQAQATEHSAFLSSWIAAQGEENVRSVWQQLSDKEWPDFSILLPLLSYLFKKTFVVINLQASGLTQDQVFTYATSNHVQVTIVSEASAINTPEERIYLGLLARDNHFVGIRPDTRDDNYSHRCSVCLNKFTQSSVIKSTSCFHYLCNECFKKLNTPHVSTCPVCWQQLSINLDINSWSCPVCRTQQKFIESKNQHKDQQKPYSHESSPKVLTKPPLPTRNPKAKRMTRQKRKKGYKK